MNNNLLESLMPLLQDAILAVILIMVPGLISICKNYINNKISNSILKEATNVVENIVIEVNQTYVDSLKKRNMFTEDAQKEAFNRALEKAKILLPVGCKNMINLVYSDLDSWLEVQIEKCVKENKNQ